MSDAWSRRTGSLPQGSAATEPDVPGATDNGRVPDDARHEIERRASWAAAGVLLAVVLWVAYLLAVPMVWARRGGALPLALVPTVGIYLFTWLGYYRHELWHGYFPHLDSRRWFSVVSYLLLADPQVYRSAHAWHHRFVHTVEDREFYCSEWATNRSRRRAQFWTELLLGNVAWEAHAFWRLRKNHGVIRAGLRAAAARLVWLLALVTTCAYLVPGSGWRCLVVYGLTVWAGAVVTRQNQWIEHLGVFSDGPLAERNLLSRNLSSASWAGWLLNLVNHDDARVHVFHHTEPRVHSRGAPGLRLPPGAQIVGVREYVRALRRYARSL